MVSWTPSARSMLTTRAGTKPARRAGRPRTGQAAARRSDRCPEPSVTVSTVRPVAPVRQTTATPGTAPPCVSRTIPSIAARCSCAQAAAAATTACKCARSATSRERPRPHHSGTFAQPGKGPAPSCKPVAEAGVGHGAQVGVAAEHGQQLVVVVAGAAAASTASGTGQR